MAANSKTHVYIRHYCQWQNDSVHVKVGIILPAILLSAFCIPSKKNQDKSTNFWHAQDMTENQLGWNADIRDMTLINRGGYKKIYEVWRGVYKKLTQIGGLWKITWEFTSDRWLRCENADILGCLWNSLCRLRGSLKKLCGRKGRPTKILRFP